MKERRTKTVRPGFRQGLKDYWLEKRAANERRLASGYCTFSVDPQQPTRLHVLAPDNPDFRREAVALGGRYRAKTKIWTFPLARRDYIMKLCISIYGSNHIRVENALISPKQ